MKTLVNVDETMNQEINKLLKSEIFATRFPNIFRLEDTNMPYQVDAAERMYFHRFIHPPRQVDLCKPQLVLDMSICLSRGFQNYPGDLWISD